MDVVERVLAALNARGVEALVDCSTENRTIASGRVAHVTVHPLGDGLIEREHVLA